MHLAGGRASHGSHGARLSKQPGVLSWPNHWPGTRTTRDGILMNRGQAKGKASSPGSRATAMPDGRQTHKEALGYVRVERHGNRIGQDHVSRARMPGFYRLPGYPASRHTERSALFGPTIRVIE